MGLRSHQLHHDRPNSYAVHVRHRPETTLLYQIIQEHWPEFQAELASHGRYLPAYVTKEFEAYLKCGRLEHGFLRVRCESCHGERLVALVCNSNYTFLCTYCDVRVGVIQITPDVIDSIGHEFTRLAPFIYCPAFDLEFLTDFRDGQQAFLPQPRAASRDAVVTATRCASKGSPVPERVPR